MQYKEEIKDYIIDNFLFGEQDKLKDDTPLFGRGIIDSTGVLELVCFIEDNFNVKIEDEELVQINFASLNRIENFLQSKEIHAA